jgi:O-methyltransferase
MQRSHMFRSAAMDVLDQIGIRDLARRTRATIRRSVRGAERAVHARVQWGWRPLVPEAEFQECCVDAIRALRALASGAPIGDYVEFGVSRGTSLACMSHALAQENAAHIRMFGFDSFRGLPREAVLEGWRPGAFYSTRGATEAYLRRHATNRERITLIEGWFAETLSQATLERHDLRHAGLIMLDCDTYSASRQALWFAQPLIRNRAVVFCDDWETMSARGRLGQKDAFEEFLRAFPRFGVRELPTYRLTSRVFLLQRA